MKIIESKKKSKLLTNIRRYERKWVFKKTNSISLINALVRSEFFFRVSYPSRFVNSIYFDDSKYESFYQNLDGDSGKRKIRLRWYGEKDKISNAYLEIKEKKGYESSKKKYRFKEADGKKISDYNDLVEIKKILHNKYFFIKDLNPILTTHYKRLYFISDNNLIRATVDTNLKSTLLNNYKLLDICKNYNDTVLEIKYGLELDVFVRQKLKNITLRLVKNSKYINSIISRPFYYS